MVGMSTITWARKFRSNKCQWLNPQDSCGVLYRKMGRDLSCWEATGPARETFIQIADEIKAYLEKYGDPVPHPVTWTIYMIGQTMETSEPMIMFCGRDVQCRKQVRKALQESGILGKYPSVRVGDASRPPDFDKLVQLTGLLVEHVALDLPHSSVGPECNQGFESNFHDTLVFAEKYGNLFGKRIAIPLHDQRCNLTSIRMATAGGILKFGERYFYLTAGHSFHVSADSSMPNTAEDYDSDFEFDIGEGSDFEYEVEFLETTSRGSITPELSGSASSDGKTMSISAPAEPAQHLEGGCLPQGNPKKGLENGGMAFSDTSQEATRGLLQAECVPIGHLLSPMENQAPPSIDYALIEIDRQFRDFHQNPLKYQYDSPYLQPQRIVRSSQSTIVLGVTGSAGRVEGTISGTPTYRTIPGSNRIQELWTTKLETNLKNGDCGSWVVDARNGDLLGHIIAGCPESGVAYIVPAYHVLEDARKTFGLDLELYTSTDFNFTAPSSPPVTLTTATATMNSRQHGMNFSGAIPAKLRDKIIPNKNEPTFFRNPFHALDSELSPRSSSSASSVHFSSSSECDNPRPRSRSPSPATRFTSSPNPHVRACAVREGNLILEEFDEDYEAFASDAESIIRPHQYEDAESDRSHSARGKSPGRDIDPAIIHQIRDLHCDESITLEERELWLERRREERRRKRRSSGSVQKRSLAQSIGSDTDDEDLQPVQFDANEAGSSARRLRRKVAGERSSLIFDDPPSRIDELEEPESCEEVVDVVDDEQGLQRLPYYEQVMDVDSDKDG